MHYWPILKRNSSRMRTNPRGKARSSYLRVFFSSGRKNVGANSFASCGDIRILDGRRRRRKKDSRSRLHARNDEKSRQV